MATLQRALNAMGRALVLQVVPRKSSVDETLLYGPLRATPAERLAAFERSYAQSPGIRPRGRAWPSGLSSGLDTPDGWIDLLPQPDGSPAYDRLRAGALRAELPGVVVQVASLEDLIAMKKAAGRPKDLVAVEELEAIQRLRRELS